ncbi:MAG: S8 family serine peptidase [Mariniblastus sp.]
MTSVQQLVDQLDKIAQESTGKLVDVIVQMESPRKDLKKLGRAAGQALSRRRMSFSPRDILPTNFSEKRNASAKVRRQTASTRTLLGKAASEAFGLKQIRRLGTDSMKILSKTDLFDSAIARMIQPAKKSAPDRPEPKPFWTSRAMPLKLSKSELMDLSKVPDVKSVHINRKLQLPPLMETQPLGVETDDLLSSTWGLQAVNALASWGMHQTRGKGVLVGVLDTGIDPEHPDLKGKVAEWAEFDFFGNRVDSDPHDSDEHGTHCAGTIIGGNESGRWIGVAPEANVAAGLVLDGAKGGTDAQVLAGIDWAVESGVDVLSMSLGGLVFDASTPSTYTEAILSCSQMGIPVVAAIGNDGEQTTGSPGNDLFALSVGAVDNENRVAGFSGGRTQILFESDFIDNAYLPLPYSKPDVTAPGVAVRSSVPGGGWKSFNGTSMATPHVAGAIALLLAATDLRGKESGSQLSFAIRDLIIGSVDDRGESGQDHRFGFGTIDTLRAIDFAKDRGY